jgi:Putative metal-binding motif
MSMKTKNHSGKKPFFKYIILGFLSLLMPAATVLSVPSTALAEPTECLSMDPSEWPQPTKPYFILLVDTSGSMTACTTPPTNYPTECNKNAAGYSLNSCGMVPSRVNDAKCALRQAVMAYSGQVNFGLATFAAFLTGCSAGTCVSDCGNPTGGSCGSDYYSCTYNVPAGGSYCGNNPNCSTGAGPLPPNLAENSWLNGSNVVVPLVKDSWWLGPPPPASNVDEILSWFDGNCDGNKELFAAGGTPTAPALRAIGQYLRAGWSPWSESNYCATGLSYDNPTPLDGLDRECRTVNILFVTDGIASDCEGGDDQTNAENVVADLFQNGVTIDGVTWNVKTYVINFAGGSQSDTDDIAAAGGTGSSLFATNETDLAQSLSEIIAGAIQPETCDNDDNNCNGCTDEGFAHYCDMGLTCCSWNTEGQRQTCLTNYENSIASSPPNGDLNLLPCTDIGEAADPISWLCYDPTEICDGIDNNCDGQTDEGTLRCGSPLHCPQTEVCDGVDNDCDGFADEDNVCGTCVPTAEVCNGCDDDCDGTVDNGTFSTLNCGLPDPANCTGTRTCQAPQSVATAGTCLAGAGYGTCTNSPVAEICDGIDNNCDGAVDNAMAQSGATCEPTGNAPGLTYGGNSQCTYGTYICQGSSGWECQGGTGPSNELCDSIDNDCDGTVDNNLIDDGGQCGSNTTPCTPGTWECQAGSLVCTGGVTPNAEICDGIDNDCNGAIDDGQLGDAPLPGANGCWNEPGVSCVHQGKTWDPPAGATCSTTGTLLAPCNTGVLVCNGISGWACSGDVTPSEEVCDAVDNDCDGEVDETIDGTLLNHECYTPGYGTETGCENATTCEGVCQPGVQICGSLNPGEWTDCIGEITPTNEVCDAVDNDCDGETDELSDMPWIGQPCPGACNGIWQCNNGVQECVGGTVEEGRCNGLDDDCDGVSDELDELQEDPMFGQTCGSNEGECVEGGYECIGGAWVCVGEVGAGEEVCDGKDNDCDGQIDWGAECPSVNETDYHCIQGDCRPECDSSLEFPCSGDTDCVETEVDGVTEWICMPKSGGECGNETCPSGWNCVDDVCVDPCESVECDSWEECVVGTCVDTSCTSFNNPCPDSDFCINHQCVTDPCISLNCGAEDAYCVRECDSEGCEATCQPLCICQPGEFCEIDGSCATDLCFDISCDLGERCNPLDGSCENNPCEFTSCASYEVCVDGTCLDNPCENLSCPPGFACNVRTDLSTTDASPYAQCEADGSFWIPGEEGETITSSGSGLFSCSTGNKGSGNNSSGLAIIFGLFFGALWFRSRKTVRGAK